LDVQSEADIPELMKRFQKNGITIVLIYANWCGHCHRFMPHFDEAAAMKTRTNNVAKINADVLPAVNHALSKMNQNEESIAVDGYPTVIALDEKAKPITTIRTDPELVQASMKMTPPSASKSNSAMEAEAEFASRVTLPESYPPRPVSEETKKVEGGNLYAAIGQAAYTLAPAAVLLATASAIMKRGKRSTKRRSIRKRSSSKRRSSKRSSSKRRNSTKRSTKRNTKRK